MIHVNVPSDSKMKLNVYMFRLKSSTVMCVEIPERVKEKTWSMKCPDRLVFRSPDFTRVK